MITRAKPDREVSRKINGFLKIALSVLSGTTVIRCTTIIGDNRIMFWPQNATNSTVIAGVKIASNTSMGLNGSLGIALDERNSWLYVADSNNNQIQRYSLNDTWSCNATTVAGGNGLGSGSHQLNNPSYIILS